MSGLTLITGGAGFIGQKLAKYLLNKGMKINILDNFSSQVHSSDELCSDLANNVSLFRGDVCDKDLLRRALIGVDKVIHLAAETGTGQSMYSIEHYFRVNVQGTAVLLDLLQNDSCGSNVASIVVASSRAVYGEGAYKCNIDGLVFPEQRTRNLMSRGIFDPVCPVCGSCVELFPTPETAPLFPMSIYGLTKQVQEQAILLFARMRGINGFGLRYQNVYGPGQSLKNPYTGILAVFSNLARQNQIIDIYEDGLESRDFVYIDDVIEATERAVNYSGQFVGALNVGTGFSINVLTVAEKIKLFFDSQSSVNITGAFRIGDIRHNIADISQLKKVLDFTPRMSFEGGIHNFLSWAACQKPENGAAYIRSIGELTERGLMGGRS